MIFFQLSIIFGAVFSIIIVRIILIASMHKATHLEGEPEGGFFAKYSKLLGTGLAASLNAIGEIDFTMCKFENFHFHLYFT